MTYERLTDEESRERVAAIIAAADLIADKPVHGGKRPRPPRGAELPSYRRLVGGAVVGVLVLIGLVVWTKATELVEPDQGDPPQVLLAGDLPGTDSSVVTVPDGPSSSGVPEPPSSPAPGTEPPESVPPETAPPQTAPPQTAPPETVPIVTMPPVTVEPSEPPHSRNMPGISSYVTRSGSTVTLNGTVPDQASHDLIVTLAGQVLLGTQVDELTIDPLASAPVPLYEVPADLLWDGDSAVLRLDAAPQIVQFGAVMKLHTGVTLDLYVHTDAHGDPAAMLEQTRQQGQALIVILVAQGVDPSRIHLVPIGSAEPLGLTGAGGENLDRRVELVFNGLYG